jgi:hypothetical protein
VWLVGLVSCHFSEGDVVPFSEDVSSVFVSFEVVSVSVVEVCDSHVLITAIGIVVLKWWSREHS